MLESFDNNFKLQIFSYNNEKEIHTMRSVCSEWKFTIDNNYIEKDLNVRKVLKCGSKGLTSVIYRDTSSKLCVVCKKQTIKIHNVYNIRVCKNCDKTHPFIMQNINTLSKKYFIKISDIDKSLIVNSRILESDIEKICIGIHGYSGLADLRNRRQMRAYKLKLARYDATDKRVSELKQIFNKHIENIHDKKIYHDFNVIFDCLKSVRKEHWDVLGDFLKFKIHTKTELSEISGYMISLLTMMDLLYKYYLILENGSLTTFMEEYSHIGYLLKRYIEYSSMDFHRLCSHFSISQKEAISFPEETNEYYQDDHVSKLEYICDKEGVDCNHVYFSDYIETGEGDPYIISRKVRKINFLIDNGFNDIYNGCTICTTRRVLNITNGYDPML